MTQEESALGSCVYQLVSMGPWSYSLTSQGLSVTSQAEVSRKPFNMEGT